jgi:anion-transporting  ArsA/GET3 family ATPase
MLLAREAVIAHAELGRGHPPLKELLKKGSILILLGTGGVGKTTVAAALGMAAAAGGLDTAVITVDPARRLRDALGLERLGGRPTRLTPKQLRAAGLKSALKLSAMMLDVKGAWDAVVERISSDPATRRRILDNPFYQSLAAEFAGSEAFAALQQLYDIHERGDFEIEVVDTPPAAHAFEFLETPARFARLLDSRAARWLFTPSLKVSRLAARLASGAARFVVRELERFAGARVLANIAEFFAAAAESFDAVVDRMHKTEALLHSHAVRFVLVTTADADRLRQARELVAEMERGGLRLSAIVINRFLDDRTWREAATSAAALGHLEQVPRLADALADNTQRSGGVDALARFFEDYRTRTLDEIARVARFAHEMPPGVRLALAPEIEVGVRDLGALKRIADYLAGGARVLKVLEPAAERIRRRGKRRGAVRGAAQPSIGTPE